MIVDTVLRKLPSPAVRRGVSAAILATLFLAASAGKASAVSCYGDYCSGKDPEATGCSAGAVTVARNDEYYNAKIRWIEVRWSPTCKTNWARINMMNPSYLWATQLPTNYTQWYSSNNGTYSWTRQIYSPQMCVLAGVKYPNGVVEKTACA